MRLAIIGAVLLAGGAVAAATGTLPAADLAALVDRVAPILLFVVAMTVVTELASEAGVFLWIARRFRHWGRGYSVLLMLFLAAFATLSTIFLSLDTTAVLLTPVVVSVTRQAGLPPLPFALITVWLANTGSLLLPISNLTNLLAQHSLGGISPAGFAALMWAPSLAAVLVPLVFVGLVFRRDLRKRYSRIPVGRVRPDAQTGSPTTASTDRVLLGGAAVVLCVMFVLRRPRVLKVHLVPWSLLLFASGLFLVMETARQLGASAFVGRLAGDGQGFPELLRLAATGALGSNVLNNLPAYLLAEPLAETPQRMAALLIGANAGPLITPWASLATLLWHDRLVRMNVLITWRGYALFGLMVAPLTVFAAVLALAAAG